MLITTHATPSPSKNPITSPTKRAITTRLLSFNAALPDTSCYFAPNHLDVGVLGRSHTSGGGAARPCVPTDTMPRSSNRGGETLHPVAPWHEEDGDEESGFLAV